jgi:hypothetical protein
MSTKNTTPGYTGWFRPLGSDRWEEVCRAESEAKCWTQLLDVPQAGDKLVLKAGRHTEDRRQRQGSLFG